MTDFYRGKRVYVTGGSSGIGLACAEQLAAAGAHVAIFARNEEKLAAARARIAQHRQHEGQQVAAYPLDVAALATLAAGLELPRREFGEPDILITSAGVATAKRFVEHDVRELEWNFQVNTLGTMATVKALLPGMLARGAGHVAMVGSLGGLIPAWGYTAYSASKAALVGFAEALQQEVAADGIRITLVCPPEVDTPMIAAEDTPPQTRLLKDMVGTLTADDCARLTLQGIARGRFLVLQGLRSRLMYHSKRLFPATQRWIVRLLLATCR
jgi:short-subunit dehydrogenase